MAEAFARHYGSDCVIAASAGVDPAPMVARDTMRAMAEKGIDLTDHFPKSLQYLARAEFDLVINMTGSFLLEEFAGARMQDWDVDDPIGMEYSDHCLIRDEIERRVIALIVELRRIPKSMARGLGAR